MKTEIEALAKKALDAKTALEALQFSQAANNVANAKCAMFGVEREMARDIDGVKHMVERFLGWELPKDFAPDGGIKVESNHMRPTGTNLFTATQAEAMVRYMINGIA